VQVAIAPGAKAFKKGESYAHGGVSLQECVTPILRVTAGAGPSRTSVRIVEIKWKRMRCAIDLDHGTPGVSVDIRLNASDPKSSVLAAPKEVEADGQVSVLVTDEDLSGKPATVVIIDADGGIRTKAETRIGG
jgi:hypothetical protein